MIIAKSPQTMQRGMTLIESLVALLILALGILGLAAMQTRMLVETRVTNSRATAIRLISDLGERIQLNAQGAQATASVPSAYEETNWDQPDATPPSGSCDMALANTIATACTGAEVASYDVWAWKRQVADALMDGRATITQGDDPRHLRVLVGWRLNEDPDITLADELKISFGASADDQCPEGFICHIDFIEIPVTW